MLGATSGENGGLNCKKRKCHVNLDSITFQQKSHENFN